MARVLVVNDDGRAPEAQAALEHAGFAVRCVAPQLPGDVLDALENVAVVAYLMGDSQNAAVNGEQLETVLLKVVDTGVRGFVFERQAGREENRHVAHARATWHIPIEEIDPAAEPEWQNKLLAAVNRSLGIATADERQPESDR